ncbi:MAG: PhnD/SsuA/transferrin family substrate-binding protein [Emcibacteraceae bacterium]|nr:PhnD/SsuA/transferrin family substrate-binding protein [Emcibacteraceae bacterium]
MIANLPMYHRPELMDAHKELWELIRDNLRKNNIHCPDDLDFDAGEMETWTSPFLFFSQTCGRPFKNHLSDKVTLIGTPDYGLQGCPPGYYRSAYVIHKSDTRKQLSDFKKAPFAFNDDGSQSGFFVTNNFFENKICSGSHINSAKMVANKEADIAAIDAVSLKLMHQYDDFIQDVKVLQWTKPTPTLPFIAYKSADQNVFYSALQSAIISLTDDSREKLSLNALVYIPEETYFAELR